MRKVTVLVGAMPAALLRVVEHLLHEQPEIQIVARPRQAGSVARYASRIFPDLIIVHQKLFGKAAHETIVRIKSLSPDSKLIVIRPDGARGGRRCGADVYLDKEAIVRRLLPIVRRLAEINRVGAPAG